MTYVLFYLRRTLFWTDRRDERNTLTALPKFPLTDVIDGLHGDEDEEAALIHEVENNMLLWSNYYVFDHDRDGLRPDIRLLKFDIDYDITDNTRGGGYARAIRQGVQLSRAYVEAIIRDELMPPRSLPL